ncbi:hypothetical protein MCETHM1_00480 [Flavobacteriaceae bacterium]|jgi:hypothetical protein
MPTQNIFIAHPTNKEQIDALKAIVKAFKIKFEISEENPYNPEFVSKIEQSKQEFKDGKSTRVKKEDLQSFLGL